MSAVNPYARSHSCSAILDGRCATPLPTAGVTLVRRPDRPQVVAWQDQDHGERQKVYVFHTDASSWTPVWPTSTGPRDRPGAPICAANHRTAKASHGRISQWRDDPEECRRYRYPDLRWRSRSSRTAYRRSSTPPRRPLRLVATFHVLVKPVASGRTWARQLAAKIPQPEHPRGPRAISATSSDGASARSISLSRRSGADAQGPAAVSLECQPGTSATGSPAAVASTAGNPADTG